MKNFVRLSIAIGMLVAVPISATAASALAVYPAAHQEALPPGMHAGETACGRTITVRASYTVDADPRTIAKWYAGKIPGSRAVDMSGIEGDDAGDNTTTALEVINADGSQTVVVTRMNFASATLANASKSIGLDKAQIGVETVSPPFGPAYVALIAQAATKGAAGAQARARLRAACKGP